VVWATAGASRPWGGLRPGGPRRGGATARGKVEGSVGELAHHHGNELETTWSMGKRRWRRSRRRPSFGRWWSSSVVARVGGEEEDVGARESEGAAAGILGAAL
jgi:hypothetical protein